MPLKILQIATAFPNWGGTELHLLNLSRQLQRRGHRVVVACRPGRFVEERAREWSLETAPFTVMKQLDWAVLRPLRAYLRRERFDVVHVHWNSDIVVPGLAALLEGVPARVLSRHVPHPFRGQLGGRLYSLALYDRIVAVSESVRRTMIASGAPASRVTTIHHGTDVGDFDRVGRPASAVREELGLTPGDVAVNLAGRMTPEKGHGDFIAAAGSLSADSPLRFVITGDGPLERDLRARVQREGLERRVQFTGYRSDMSDLLNAMEIVAVPSTWQEPCSAVLQQGMAMRKPVVGTRVGGTPEIIDDGVTGLVVPPKDPRALAAAFHLLAGDPARREAMGKRGRARVEAAFTLAGMTDKIEALYHELIERKRGARA